MSNIKRCFFWGQWYRLLVDLVFTLPQSGQLMQSINPFLLRTTPRPENFEQDGKKIQPEVFLSLTFFLKVVITFCQVFNCSFYFVLVIIMSINSKIQTKSKERRKILFINNFAQFPPDSFILFVVSMISKLRVLNL